MEGTRRRYNAKCGGALSLVFVTRISPRRDDACRAAEAPDPARIFRRAATRRNCVWVGMRLHYTQHSWEQE